MYICVYIYIYTHIVIMCYRSGSSPTRVAEAASTLCVYIYIYKQCVYMCIYIIVCVCICIYIYICIIVCMSLSLYTYICVMSITKLYDSVLSYDIAHAIT